MRTFARYHSKKKSHVINNVDIKPPTRGLLTRRVWPSVRPSVRYLHCVCECEISLEKAGLLIDYLSLDLMILNQEFLKDSTTCREFCNFNIFMKNNAISKVFNELRSMNLNLSVDHSRVSKISST